ncbi:Histone transcription regulator 3 [Rhinocladiella similis]
MSGFTALNVEPEDTFEEEIDDTKEIQLEEAFKLYQHALKLHSQGPEYFQEALAAYQELIQSEIFKYPEAVSDYSHDETEDDPTAASIAPDTAAAALLPSSAAESSASSIPQLLYLAFKNRGQFLLDVAHHDLPDKKGSRAGLCRYYVKACNESIRDFAKALERDDADLDLWKKSARIAGVLSSQRVTRFCLESVLAGDDEDAEQTIDLSGLDEAFAAGELEQVLEVLYDDLSRLRTADIKVKSNLLNALRRTNDPYPFLPKRGKALEYLDERHRPLSFEVATVELAPTSFVALGKAIEQIVSNLQHDSTSYTSATQVKLVSQGLEAGRRDDEMEVTSVEIIESHNSADALPDQEMKDIPQDRIDNKATIESPQPQVSPEKGHTEDTAPGGKDDEKADEAMDDSTIEVHTAMPKQPSYLTPTTVRKRSATAAGNEEPEGRTKSKRLRARESLADTTAPEEDGVPEDPQSFLDQLAAYEQADQTSFDVVNSLLAKFKLTIYLSSEAARGVFWQGGHDKKLSDIPEEDLILLADMKNSLKNWSDDKSQALMQGHGSQDFNEGSTGMSLFAQHSKSTVARKAAQVEGSNEDALLSMAKRVNARSVNIYQAAYDWLFSTLVSGVDSTASLPSSYMREIWPQEMKDTVTKLAHHTDAYLYETFRETHSSLNGAKQLPHTERQILIKQLFEFVQTLFELHLDIFTTMTDPNTTIEEEIQVAQDDCVRRWATLADDYSQLYLAGETKPELTDTLVLRFIWATTINATMTKGVDKTHVVLCLDDLKAILERANADTIHLPNNASMAVISVNAIEQEISRLSTIDFFKSIFDNDSSDPVAVIEKLEPILESTSEEAEDESGSDNLNEYSTQVGQLRKFLESGGPSLKLFLWRRLQNAYTAISYPPKVVSCLLRSVEMSFKELYTSRHLEMSGLDRQISMLRWLRDIDELMLKVLIKLTSESNAFECLDEAHLFSTLSVVTGLVKLLHGFAIYEDSVRVGQTVGPQLKGAASSKSYDKSKERFRDMLVRAWTLQYLLLKEAAAQDPAAYPRASDDLAEYLGSVHHMLGIRNYCRYAGKTFLKLARTELGVLKTQQDYSADMSQVLFDLYQLHFVTGIGDRNHGCSAENMDKKTAATLIPFIMQYTDQMQMKDILKSELKGTIEKIQQVLGSSKVSPAVAYNRRVTSAYLKSPIIANDLYRSVRGVGDLQTRPVQYDMNSPACQGWLFLLGYLTLAKYKSVKRVQPTPTNDLDSAATFFRQDLDHNIEKWESWYRLAQVYEAKIEDDLIWNSTKLNDSRGDIALLERQAIHCYIMASAMVLRNGDDKFETTQKMQEMFAEFGTRLYSSSRPPLNMEAFRTDKNMRHMSSMVDRSMSKQPFHQPISEYALWHFAAYLLGKKFNDKPKPWTTHYTRAKCLWKMFQRPENNGRVSAEDVIDGINGALGALPKKEKSNEPILEPHYKLVSLVHKMVKRGAISPLQGQEYMSMTRFAHGIHLADDEGDVDWEPYVLDILHKLEHADKSNWHHRITARAAHVLYDDDPTIANALGAKYEFTKQIFTKTMTIQVWKPEFERAGRHYVYTGRYVTYFSHLLEQLSDRVNLDQLVRRIRRKTTDFLDHAKIWEDVVTAFVRCLRRIGKIPDGRERTVFDGMNHEEFTKRSEQLEQWSHEPDTSTVYLDIMKDGIDLKRLNNSLMKGPLIDDLIGDSYACLYEEYVRQLPPEEQPQPQPAPLPQGTFINMTAEVLQSGEEDAEKARVNDMLRAQGDGAADGPLSVSISAPVGLGLQNPASPFPTTGPQAEATRVAGKPGRVKTVTRREIQRKAEAAIVKPPPIKTPILGKRPIVEISTRTGQDSPLDKRLQDTREEDGERSKSSSRRGSVHDSDDGEADGEDESGSELSDLDDLDEDRKQLMAELEKSNNQQDDEGDEGGREGGGDEGEEEEAEDADDDDQQRSYQEDEEMADANDGGIEIKDSQENVDEQEVREQDDQEPQEG